MSDSSPSYFTRRQWLGRVSGPAVVASLGAGLAARSLGADAAADAPTSASDANRGARIYNIRDHGAKGDGTSLDSAAVQAAIDLCAQDGGGTVLVPAGDFVVGTLELRSHVTLHLAARGRLLGSADPAHYRAGAGIPSGNGNIVLLSAHDADNVTIEGPGTIDGNGARFFNGRGDNTGPGAKSSEGYFQRPHLLVFHRCRNLRLRDAFLTASAYHCVRILECERVFIEGVRIHNRVNKNNDGFHFNSSRYVHISNCDVACQDDACALFGSNQFVTVVNSSFSTRWSVFRFGGGEAENITISNCLIYETYGCPIKMRCGARSRFENITFSNLILKDVTGPISIGLDSRSRRPSSDRRPATPGVVRNIAFNGIRASVVGVGRQHADLPFPSEYRPGETRTCITLNGVGEEFLENISFTDVQVTFDGGGTAEEAGRAIPQLAGEYFEIGTPSAYGLFARNVRGLTLNGVRFEMRQPDARPAVVLERVADASFNSFAAQGSPSAQALVRCVDSHDLLLTACRVLTPVSIFLRAEGAACAGITIDGGDLTKAGSSVMLEKGAAPTAARTRG
ncbi:MAG TPA: glycosyl hydrolase family 28 protein [Opitutaceae bacterium]|nr:glycosyl hydrolase family 28 protein [Opitutaceae bacterium]